MPPFLSQLVPTLFWNMITFIFVPPNQSGSRAINTSDCNAQNILIKFSAGPMTLCFTYFFKQIKFASLQPLSFVFL